MEITIFNLITPIAYWMLIIMWSFILFFCLKRLRMNWHQDSLIVVLFIILTIDAFRTLFDSVYVGAWSTARAGLLPISIHDVLAQPQMVIIPTFLSVFAAGLIITILFRYWLPREAEGIKHFEKAVNTRTRELSKIVEKLETEILHYKRMEEALAARDMELYNLADSSPGLMGTFYQRPDGSACMPYTSPQIENLFGLRSEDVVDDATPLLARTHPDDANGVNASIAESARTMTPWRHEYRVNHPTRGEIWLEGSTNPKPHPDGGVIWYGFVHDITQRKQTEDALRRSETEKTILNQISNIFLTIPDEAIFGEILEVVLKVMGSKYGIFGYIENEDLIIPSLTKEVWNKCQVTDKSIVFPSDCWGNSLWGRSIREKKTFSSDGPFHTHEGHIPIDHFLTVPIVYGNEAIGLICVADGQQGYTEEDRNILESISGHISPILNARLQRDRLEQKRKRAEEELRKLSHAVEQSPALIVITDTAGKIEYVNPKFTEVTGYAKIEVLGKHPRILESGKLPKEFYKQMWETITSGREWRGEFHNRKKSGELYWESASISPILDTAGTITHFVAVKEDITERKRLEAQFRQAQKMESVGRLAGGVAHDFNNMLGVIIGHTELALDQFDPGQPHYTDLQEIRKAARRSADLTRQLLAYARKQTVTPKVLDLNKVMEGMLRMLGRLIGEDIDLAWFPESELWPVKVDPSQIDQILANLCVNARDAISGVGKVTIETGNTTLDEAYCADHPGFIPGEYVLLAVSDNGHGMDKETLENIFEPFYTTKEMSKGTGLGLATVYGIVKQNNGFVNAYSESEHGTTFKIYLPRHAALTEPARKESDEVLDLRGHETILLVEDDPATLKMAKRIVKKFGYQVLAASRPGEAIRLAKEHAGEIHLLITDVIMPEMNGQELAKNLTPFCPGLKHLFMSGYTGNVIAHHGVLEEGENFIQKPFSMQNLAAKIREVLEGE